MLDRHQRAVLGAGRRCFPSSQRSFRTVRFYYGIHGKGGAAAGASCGTLESAHATLADELGAESGRSALLSRDQHFYRRAASLDVADLPYQYWERFYGKKARVALKKLSRSVKAALGSIEDALATVKERYLEAYARYLRAAK